MFNMDEIVNKRVRDNKIHTVNSLEHGYRKYYYNNFDFRVLQSEFPIATSADSKGNIRYSKEFHLVPDWDIKLNRILIEEIGKISKVMNDFSVMDINKVEYEESLRECLIQNISVLSAWVDKIDGISIKDRI